MRAPLSCQIMWACDLFALSKSCIRIRRRIKGRTVWQSFAWISGFTGDFSPSPANSLEPMTYLGVGTLTLGHPHAVGQRTGSVFGPCPPLFPNLSISPQGFQVGFSTARFLGWSLERFWLQFEITCDVFHSGFPEFWVAILKNTQWWSWKLAQYWDLSQLMGEFGKEMSLILSPPHSPPPIWPIRTVLL